MAKISDILQGGRAVSFEFFPPKTDEAEAVLERTLLELEPLDPSFVSVTYGAGGTTRERTHDLVVGINRDTTMTAMAHLTCAAHTRAELEEIVGRYRDAGVENILALGGDPPTELHLPDGRAASTRSISCASFAGSATSRSASRCIPSPIRGPRRSRRTGGTAPRSSRRPTSGSRSSSSTPTTTSASSSRSASRASTKPVIPGIMPVLSIAGTKRMTELQGSEFPEWFMDKLRPVEDDPAAVRRIGIEEASRLCQDLLDGGAPGLHFFTLNRSTATREIYENLALG